ncbi:MAG: glycosyltransferase family 2 protein [Acidimicrobiaceae bacterium]|nr:glycosyltransferase family 2 protein [Acidimicrobiaceae bacterium]
MTGPDSGAADAAVAVVVNYNAASHLGTCLASLGAAGVCDVIVVDNGSVDDSRDVVASAGPGVTWLPLGANLGYGAAANRAARKVAGRDLLVCNPDIEVKPGAVAALRARLAADPGLGVVGPRLLNADGSVYPSARTFPDLLDAFGHGLLGLVLPNNPFTRRYRMLDRDYDGPADVDWVSGAFVLIRRRTWEEVHGFDPHYFMYLEDVDFCWRAGRAGWRIGYVPDAEVVHVQGVSAARHPYRMLVAHHLSMWRFARQTSVGAQRLALPVVAVGLVCRVAVASLHHRLGGFRRPSRRLRRSPQSRRSPRSPGG